MNVEPSIINEIDFKELFLHLKDLFGKNSLNYRHQNRFFITVARIEEFGEKIVKLLDPLNGEGAIFAYVENKEMVEKVRESLMDKTLNFFKCVLSIQKFQGEILPKLVYVKSIRDFDTKIYGGYLNYIKKISRIFSR